MADTEQGACFDGLQASGVNRNQGAESTLAYLWTQWHSTLAEKARTLSVGRSHASSVPTI